MRKRCNQRYLYYEVRWSTRPVHGARMKTLSGFSHIWVGDKRESVRSEGVRSEE